ncbi:hypothetical protein OEZ86_005037 [Tetradesmus obliquus]|nr:hypothetical protein OEZ86_005037 [Tetradesmus obliquus]
MSKLCTAQDSLALLHPAVAPLLSEPPTFKHTSIHTKACDVPLTFPSVCIWGANTNVGKTLVSAGLVAAAVRNKVFVQFVKPVQTGYPQDSDSRLVAAAAAHATSAAAAQAYLQASSTLFAYSDPVSPHLAAAQEGRVIPDADIVAGLAQQLQQFTAGVLKQGSGVQGLSVVETAGGVTSPGPSGSLQGDLLRPLGLPALLVGDPALGGIATTLSAYESLLLRGHSPAAVIMMADGRLNNVEAVAAHLQHAAVHRLGQPLPVLSLPLCQPPAAATSSGGSAAPGIDPQLAAWLAASAQHFDGLLALLQQQHEARLAWLREAPGAAAAAVWWPFTQHAKLPHGEVTVVDGRAGEDWLVYRQQQGSSSSSSGGPVLTHLHDAASSWWTQTAASSQLQLELTRVVAAAAGRYMHVMWPQVAHAPGLELSRALLAGPLGAGWAGRAFFSDDGSTAVEVALKMAFRKFMADHALLQQRDGSPDNTRLEVLALQNSYHGDTLGAMDCAAASAFNGRLQSPWYAGRGLFLDPPYLQLQQGRWRLQAPDWLQQQQQQQQQQGSSSSGEQGWSWGSRQEAFDMGSRSSSGLRQLYEQHITQQLQQHEQQRGVRLGSLLIEPLLQGAGGMLLADPLFQATLVQVARAHKIPVIYDEVFTGCWRLGAPSAGSLLGQAPDIACYAKLLTGGVAPLAVTLASEEVFDAFKGASKVEALLHGHSYTAYPLGCAAALASLAILQDPKLNPNLCTPELPGRCQKALSGSSNSSSSSSSISSTLRASGIALRPLGPVVYCMLTPTSDRGGGREVLDAEGVWGASGSDGVIV